jgi:hypothetical protein
MRIEGEEQLMAEVERGIGGRARSVR